MFSAAQNPEFLDSGACLPFLSLLFHNTPSIPSGIQMHFLTWRTDLECISREVKYLVTGKKFQTLYLTWLLTKMWISTKLLLWTPRQNRHSKRHTRTRISVKCVVNITGLRLTHKKDRSHTLIQHQNENSGHVSEWLTASWVQTSERGTW